MVARHPSLSGRQFVVFGASYAGVYIPMLAEEILKRPDFPLSLAAIGVGNAAIGHFPGWNFPEGGQTLTSHDVPNDTASHVDFYFYSGLFSQSLYAEIQDACGGDRSALDFPDAEMQGLLRQMHRAANKGITNQTNQWAQQASQGGTEHQSRLLSLVEEAHHIAWRRRSLGE